MKLRLSSSERLVDLGGVADLKGIKVDGGKVVIGAMTTHAAVAASAEVRKAIPALAELAGGIGDQMVRNMGTIGGSIANADRGLLSGCGARPGIDRATNQPSARSPETPSSPGCSRRRSNPAS